MKIILIIIIIKKFNLISTKNNKIMNRIYFTNNPVNVKVKILNHIIITAQKYVLHL